MIRKSEYGEGTLYWVLIKQTGSKKRLGLHLFHQSSPTYRDEENDDEGRNVKQTNFT